jgi:hypothetical protein
MSTQQEPNTTTPEQPNKPDEVPGQQPTSPVNPDPKAHPIHPAIPVQPIHEGTDPAKPIVAGDGA